MSSKRTKENQSIVVLTTCGDWESASRLANELVAARLAACVQIDQPVVSVYRWENKVETAQEYRLVIKSTRSQEKSLFEKIVELHSYEVPQVISLPVQNGTDAYLSWLFNEVGNNEVGNNEVGNGSP